MTDHDVPERRRRSDRGTDVSTEDIDDALRRAREAIGEGLSLSESTDIVRASGSGLDLAAERKKELVSTRAAALRKQQEAEVAYQEARKAVEAEKNRLQQLMWKLQADMKPLLELAEKLGDGIDALNIYTGRDQDTIQLRDGEPAPADEVIYVRQTVLAMDEESVIAADGDGMDYRDVDAFAEWLVASDEHIEQIIPERKGVVAIIPRRAEKRYEDVWEAESAKKWNEQTYWVIRNGERIYLSTTEFTVGNRTVPTPREFTDLFVVRGSFGREDRHMEPGSAEWEKAEKAADKRTRHYMKVALLLEGLADRTTVFHPREHSTSFLSQDSYDSGRIRVILDDEKAITSGRPSFTDWLKLKRADMHEGVRVIGAFASRMRLYQSKDYGSAHVRPEGARPDNNVAYSLRKYDGGAYSDWKWSFSFDRSDMIFDADSYEQRAPKTKGTGYLSGDEDWFVPVDLVTEEEIDYYLSSRTERRHYLNMFPTLRAALAFKRAEREAETPFRTALIGALSKKLSVEDAEREANDLIDWYKTANKWHRALDEGDVKASKAILREHARRTLTSGKNPAVSALIAEHPDALVIARRTSDIIVVKRTARRYENVPQNVFVDVLTYGLRGALKEEATFSLLRRSQVARWTILHETEGWKDQEFDVRRAEHFTDEEIDEIIEVAKEAFPTLAQVRVDERGIAALVLDDGSEGTRYAYRGSPENGKGDVRSADITARAGSGVRPSTKGLFGSARDITATYWGEPRARSTVYVNEEIVARVMEAVAEKERARQERFRVNGIVRGYLRRIEEDWTAEETERIHERFREDYGDETLWEGYLKTITFPNYPGEDAYDVRVRGSWHYTTHPVTAALLKAVEGGEDIAGATVAEFVTRHGGDVENVNESIRGIVLRFGLARE